MAPTATIDSGPTGTVTTSGATFTFSGSDAAPSSGGPTFECKLDAASYAACTSPVNLTSLADGSHTFYVRPKDTAGNTGTPVSQAWKVDTTPPVVTVTIPTADGLGGYFVTKPVTVGVSATDATSNVSSFACTVDGSPVSVGNLTNIGTPAASGTFSVNTDGTHPISCTAADSAGNSGAAAESSNTGTVKIDTVAPTATIDSGPTGTVTTSGATFTFSGSDAAPSSGGPTFECKLDAASYAACTSPVNLTSLADGSHTFYVRPKDTAGNTGTPVSQAWKVDTTPPVVTVTIPTADGLGGYFVTKPVTVGVSATDATFERILVRLHGGRVAGVSRQPDEHRDAGGERDLLGEHGWDTPDLLHGGGLGGQQRGGGRVEQHRDGKDRHGGADSDD